MGNQCGDTSAQKTTMSNITMPHGGRSRGLASRLSYLRKQSKLGLRSKEGKWKAYSCSVGILTFSFVITLLIASLLTPTTITSAEENSSSSAQADGYTMTLSATSAVNLALSVSDSDSMTVKLGNVSVTTTSPGYRLYISMMGDTTSLTGIADGISGSIPATSGTITSPTSLTRGTWGYAIPSSGVAHLVANGFNTSYAEMPSTTPDTSKKFATPPVASSPQMIAESSTATSSDSYPIYYAVMANSSTAPGDYSNSVMFTAVADAATAETSTVTPSSANAKSASTFTIKTSLYGTENYTVSSNVYFLSSEEYNSISGTNVEALGKTPLTCNITSSAPLTLSCTLPAQSKSGDYYVYVKATAYDKVYASSFTILPVDFFSMSTMQQMAEHPEYCMNATTPATTATTADTTGARAGNTAYVPQVTLTDTRNNEAYTVRKLADGNCWMTENLRLELEQNQVLSPSTSDVAVDTTVTLATQPYNQASTNRYNWGVASTSDFSEATVDRWLSRSTKKNGEWTRETNPVQSGAPATDQTGENQKTGVFYNWYTATAGTGTYSITTGGVTASSSICPAGWQLPRYSNVDGTSNLAPSGSWENLIRDTYKIITTQGDQGSSSTANATLHGFPFSLPYSGYVNWQSGAIVQQGARGYSSSAGSASQTYARTIIFYGTGVWPEDTGRRLSGFSVRCVAKTFWSIDTMQSMTPAIASSVSTPSTTADSAVATSADYEALSDKTTKVPQRTLYDVRDQESYTVRKLADGNVWMTENLRKEFTAGEVLTPATTDVTEDTTVNLATQPSTQTETGTRTDGTTWDLYDWGQSPTTESSTNRWLSRGSLGTTGDLLEADLYINYTGENQKIGIYYNWYTATASTGNWNITKTNAPSSICPKNWGLPKDTGSGSLTYLIVDAYHFATGSSSSDASVADTVDALHSFPFTMPISSLISYTSGATVKASSSAAGRLFYLWTIAPSGQNGTFTLALRNNSTAKSIETRESHMKQYGWHIRCVVK